MVEVFLIWYFLNVSLSESRCMFAVGPSSYSSHSVFILFIHSEFLWYSFCSIFYKKFLFLLHSFVDLCLCTIQQFVGRIFLSLFGMSCFICVTWSCQGTICIFYFAYIIIFINFFHLYCQTRLPLLCFWSFHSIMFLYILLSLVFFFFFFLLAVAVSVFVHFLSFPIQLLYFFLFY